LDKREVRGEESEARLSVTRGDARGAAFTASLVGEETGLGDLGRSGLPCDMLRERRVANVADHRFLAGDAVGGELIEDEEGVGEMLLLDGARSRLFEEDVWESIAGASAARAVVLPETPSKSASRPIQKWVPLGTLFANETMLSSSSLSNLGVDLSVKYLFKSNVIIKINK
jgi:hypothetical protein